MTIVRSGRLWVAGVLLGIGILGVVFVASRVFWRPDFMQVIGDVEQELVCDSGADVLVYGVDSCSHCREAKRILEDAGVAFDYRDIQLSDGAYGEFLSISGRVYPVIITPLFRMNGLDARSLEQVGKTLAKAGSLKTYLCGPNQRD